MATAVRITRGLTANTVFGNQLEKQVNEAIARQADLLAKEAVLRVNAIVAKEFDTATPVSQRRPGKHLLGSFTASVRLESGPYPVVISLRSNAPAVKVNALNNGSAPHEIGGNGRRLAFPDLNGTTSPRTGDRRAVRQGPIVHPGTRPSWFMQRALEQATSAVFHKTVRIPRR